jgi:predicted house-cleaning noncanonical NTP pyrophosphatase (MazG superfamily)
MSTKLVRDKIPQIIKKQGKNIVFRIAEKQEYKELLLAKLQEEVNEFVSDQNEEEIADILEVIDALIEKYQFYR